MQEKSFKRYKNSSKWNVPIPLNCTESSLFSMYLADMDIPIFPKFKVLFNQRMANLNNFTYKDRSQQYYTSLINWYKNQHNCSITKQNLVMSPSICNLYSATVLAFSNIGDDILIFTPVYDFYAKSAIALGRNIIQSRLITVVKNQGQDKGLAILQIDFQDLQLKICKSKCKIITICNPHNPSGRIWSKQDTQRIIKIAQNHKILIFSDQIMCDLRHQHKYKEFQTLANHSYQNIIVGNSISKAFNVSSLQGGYGIIKSSIVKQKFEETSILGLKMLANEPAMIMSEVIYSSTPKLWLKDIKKLIRTNFDELMSFKRQKFPDLLIYSLDAAYLVLIDFKGYIKSEDQLISKLTQKGIILNIMTRCFFPPCKTALARISISVDIEYFRQFLASLEKVLVNQSKL